MTAQHTHISQYIARTQAAHQKGNATEHTYRGDLTQLMRDLLPNIDTTNEPQRIKCGAPDYVLTDSKGIAIGYIEAKDIGDKDLKGEKKTGNKEQFDRYKAALANIIFTDYLDFHFYRDGALTHTIPLAKLTNGHITPCPDQFDTFINEINAFAERTTQTIKSPESLATMMAGRAKQLADSIHKALNNDIDTGEHSKLTATYNQFKTGLMEDISPTEFADVYAQTIAYGMFAARYHDSTLPTFDRREAAELIPHSNPFLRQLFTEIAGNDVDEGIRWILDDLVHIFQFADVKSIMSKYGRAAQMNDPVIHFYETFLAAYDPKLRKARGVWYTPEPVVDFIVRAVDDVLKSDFGLKDGLTDESKIQLKIDHTPNEQKKSNKAIQTQHVHRVQILDPATGTGTFLTHIVKHIHKQFKNNQGGWQSYVDAHLIPRLNGFELLMASYAMAHLKLDMTLADTGYTANRTSKNRFNIYLTNSLEEHHTDAGGLLAYYLAEESRQASRIKDQTPVMVVIGNPPYSVSSSNDSPWIRALISDYKKDMKERNIQPLSDDYIKFIRFGQHFIDKNESGVLAYISNNSFIDGIIHRQMRKHLLESFDDIYILDLHGNAKKKETAPDGSPDQNVFDIMQGVSINLFVKTGKKAKTALATVHHHELQGKRSDKYAALNEASLKNMPWKSLQVKAPEYFFVPKNFEVESVYKHGFSVDSLFGLFSSGVSTHRDDFVIDIDSQTLENRVQTFFDLTKNDNEIKTELMIKDNRDWIISDARKGFFDKEKIQKIFYRPFDNREIYYDSSLIDFGREAVMTHILQGCLAFTCLRQSRSGELGSISISNHMVGKDAISSLDRCSVFPLYIYPETTIDGVPNPRVPNFNPQTIAAFAAALGLAFVSEKAETVTTANTIDSDIDSKPKTAQTFAPIDVLDYIYAVLHSPKYRDTYKEFLKIDFPRVPYPTDAAAFWQLVALGAQLRAIHLLDDAVFDDHAITTRFVQLDAKGQADNRITRKIVKTDWEITSDIHNPAEPKTGRVFINDNQCFENIPETAFNFYIGGYQPAQKWLKDRQGRTLERADQTHYRRIIDALTRTATLMTAVDEVLVF